jgi:protocatechuate 3,4-dioxygenase beta subunit
MHENFPRRGMTRRDVLFKCAAFGCLTVAPSLSLAEAIAQVTAMPGTKLRPTPPNEIGPFYKRLAPDKSLMRVPGDPGLPLNVSGRVLDSQGRSLEDAKIEIWHADYFGHYDLEGYRFRSSIKSGSSGKYAFKSILPGHYPGRVCQHVHYMVTAPEHKSLVTQLYFATDPVFEGDPDRNFTRDPLLQDRELVRPVTLAGDPKLIHAEVGFDLVLEPL